MVITILYQDIKKKIIEIFVRIRSVLRDASDSAATKDACALPKHQTNVSKIIKKIEINNKKF